MDTHELTEAIEKTLPVGCGFTLTVNNINGNIVVHQEIRENGDIKDAKHNDTVHWAFRSILGWFEDEN